MATTTTVSTFDQSSGLLGGKFAVIYSIVNGSVDGAITTVDASGGFTDTGIVFAGTVPAGATNLGKLRLSIDGGRPVLVNMDAGDNTVALTVTMGEWEVVAQILAAQSDAAIDAALKIGDAIDAAMNGLEIIANMAATGATDEQMVAKLSDLFTGVQMALGEKVPADAFDDIKKMIAEQLTKAKKPGDDTKPVEAEAKANKPEAANDNAKAEACAPLRAHAWAAKRFG